MPDPRNHLLEVLADRVREAVDDPELNEWLRHYRMTLPEVAALVATVATDVTEPRWIGLRRAEQAAVLRLALHGLEAPAIARLLNVRGDTVALYMAWRRKRNPAQDAIMRAHWSGGTVARIARETGKPRGAVYDVLAAAGAEPNREPPKTDPAQPRRIVDLRNEGHSYGEIRDDTGATYSQIRNALRRAAARGEVPGYGLRPRSGWRPQGRTPADAAGSPAASARRSASPQAR